MGGSEPDFMERVRGMWTRIVSDAEDEPMEASGPGAEGYYLTREMAREADDALEPRASRRSDEEDEPGFMAGFAWLGRAWRSRGLSMGYDRGYRGGFGEGGG